MTIDYKTKGTCSRRMVVEVEDGVVQSLQVYGGCDGNLKGLSQLVAGMKVEDVIQKLDGIRCGRAPRQEGTSPRRVMVRAMALDR